MRFYGSEIFEGAEVDAADYERLMALREEEEWRKTEIKEDAEARRLEIDRWENEEIEETERKTNEEIEAVLDARQFIAVYEVKGERGRCALCDAKIGTIGTMDELEEKDCVPPFHQNCRCFLEEVGYCVKSGM